jgi:excisionase family DNA binding protein
METTKEPAMRRWLNVDQLISVLPLRKSRVYYLTHTRQIPFVRLGKTLLFDYDSIVKWVDAHGQPTGISRQAR